MNHKTTDGFGFRKLSAIYPLVTSPVAKNTPPWSRVLRLRQGGSGDTILSRTGIQGALEDGEGRDAVRSIGRSAVGPAITSLVAEDAAPFAPPRFAGTGVERALVDSEGERKKRRSGTTTVYPTRTTVVVHPELEVTPVRLIRDHARVALEGEMKATTLRGVILAHEIATRPFVRLQPEREGKILRPEVRSFEPRHFERTGDGLPIPEQLVTVQLANAAAK